MNRFQRMILLLPAVLLLISSIQTKESQAAQTRYRFSQDSVIGFEAKSTLHPFAGKTGQISGLFSVDWENLADSGGGFIEIQAASLDTGNGLRDKKMRNEHLQANQYPLIRFESTSCAGLTESNLILTGQLDLHGVHTPIAIPVVLNKTEKNQIKISGKIPLRLSAYGIPVPSVLGLIKMEDEILITFDLEAEPAE